MKSAALPKTDLEQAQRQLSDWRRQQTGRMRLPEAMWNVATELARIHGTGLVARALRLNYYKLRARVNGKGVRLTKPLTFVEVKSPNLPGTAPEECRVELFDGSRGGMIVVMRGDLSTLLALAQSFWSRRR